MKLIIVLFALLVVFFTACNSNTISETEAMTAKDTFTTAILKKELQPVENEKENPLALGITSNAIQIITKSNGSTSEISFDSPQEHAIEVVTKVLGAKPAIGINGECGAGPLKMATWENGLTLLFQEKKGEWFFVGWSANQAKNDQKKLTTMAGIGVGSTKKEMEAVYVIKVDKSSLGYEFSTKSNDLFGIFDAAGDEGKITNMWSGVSCNFR